MESKTDTLSLPPDKLPDCWNDEQRINSLYAPFRNRSVNPRDWDSKLLFWKNLIELWCVHLRKSCFIVSELKKSFIRNGRVPGCLDIVVEEMHRNGELKTLDVFMQKPAKTWSGWALDLVVKKPLSWSYNKLKNTVSSPVRGDVQYVHVEAVRKQCEELFKLVDEQHRDKLIGFEELLKVCGLNQSSIENTKLLLHYMYCENQVDLIENSFENDKNIYGSLLIKFAKGNGKVVPISETDLSLYKLEQNEKVLLRSLEKLEEEKTAVIADAKAYLKKGLRQVAKGCLRKKHEIEKSFEKRAAALENVQILLTRIKQADSDGQVLDTYRQALSTLKTTFKDTGLNEDQVADTMLEIGEVLDVHADIQDTLSKSVVSWDEAELEEELAELLEAPSVPTPPPGSPPSVKKTAQEDDEINELQRRLEALHSNLPSVPKSKPQSPEESRMVSP